MKSFMSKNLSHKLPKLKFFNCNNRGAFKKYSLHTESSTRYPFSNLNKLGEVTGVTPDIEKLGEEQTAKYQKEWQKHVEKVHKELYTQGKNEHKFIKSATIRSYDYAALRYMGLSTESVFKINQDLITFLDKYGLFTEGHTGCWDGDIYIDNRNAFMEVLFNKGYPSSNITSHVRSMGFYDNPSIKKLNQYLTLQIRNLDKEQKKELIDFNPQPFNQSYKI